MTMELKDKLLVFTLTTGRSGSGLLACIMDSIPVVSARHEPAPSFEKIYQKIRKHPNPRESSDLFKWWLDIKLPVIDKAPGPVYIETSHLFCKGFMESFIRVAETLGISYKFIILTRDNHQVAQSMYELNTVPGKTPKGSYWYMVPGEPNTFTNLPGWGSLHDYQLCYWYTLEIQARINHAMIIYPDRCVSIDLYDLTHNREKVMVFLQGFGLEQYADSRFWSRWETLIHSRINNKDGSKDSKKLPQDYLERLRAEVYNRIYYKKKIEDQETEVLS